MACHEIAALRLGLMNLLGIDDEAARQHELAELGTGADTAGPIRSLTEAPDLGSLKTFFENALTELDLRVTTTPTDHPQLPYLRTLMVLTRKVDLELESQMQGLSRLWRDLDEMHDFVHELYPAD